MEFQSVLCRSGGRGRPRRRRLEGAPVRVCLAVARRNPCRRGPPVADGRRRMPGAGVRDARLPDQRDRDAERYRAAPRIACRADKGLAGGSLIRRRPVGEGGRSEEHTSELQSLMRISYAVFCLKKKKTKKEKYIVMIRYTIKKTES